MTLTGRDYGGLDAAGAQQLGTLGFSFLHRFKLGLTACGSAGSQPRQAWRAILDQSSAVG